MDDKQKIQALLRELATMKILLAMVGYHFVQSGGRPEPQDPERAKSL